MSHDDLIVRQQRAANSATRTRTINAEPNRLIVREREAANPARNTRTINAEHAGLIVRCTGRCPAKPRLAGHRHVLVAAGSAGRPGRPGRRRTLCCIIDPDVPTNPRCSVQPITDGELRWRPLVADDLPLLARWLAEPAVARWWNHDSSPEGVDRAFGASVRGEEPGEDLVVLLDGHPVGLVQRAVIGDYPEDLAELAAVVEVPDGAVEIDYLIGDAALRGRGLGSRMIAALVADTWRTHPNVPAVITPVVAANVASWRALEKAGFRRVAEGELTPDNPVDDPLHVVYRVDRPRH